MTSEDCPCYTGPGPNCLSPNPNASLLSAPAPLVTWVVCTLPLGHDGDEHVYCGGGSGKDRPEWHGMYRWRKESS